MIRGRGRATGAWIPGQRVLTGIAAVVWMAGALTACTAGSSQVESFTVGRLHYEVGCIEVPQALLGRPIPSDQLHRIARRVLRARTVKGVDQGLAVAFRLNGHCPGMRWFVGREENLSLDAKQQITKYLTDDERAF